MSALSGASGPVDPSPLERAFRDEWGQVVAVLARASGDLDLAEEATQEAFITGYRHLAFLRQGGRFADGQGKPHRCRQTARH